MASGNFKQCYPIATLFFAYLCHHRWKVAIGRVGDVVLRTPVHRNEPPSITMSLQSLVCLACVDMATVQPCSQLWPKSTSFLPCPTYSVLHLSKGLHSLCASFPTRRLSNSRRQYTRILITFIHNIESALPLHHPPSMQLCYLPHFWGQDVP